VQHPHEPPAGHVDDDIPTWSGQAALMAEVLGRARRRRDATSV